MSISRRTFFFYGALLTGAVPLGGYGTTQSLKLLGYKSPNEKLNIAGIGAGGKAAQDVTSCGQTENIVALCDVDAKSAERVFKQYDKVPKYDDYRKMLDKEAKNIDAVIVTIPDHMHACAALNCMELGKHVYVQKPLARTVWENRMLTQAAAYYKVATQMGNQGYSEDGTRLCAEMIWSGAIGDVKEVHAFTNRPIWPQGLTEIPKPTPVPSTLNWDAWLGIADDRPFTEGDEAYKKLPSIYRADYGFYAPFNWRGFYDFGCGALGDMACHVLGAPNMALRLGAPTSVECIKIEQGSNFMFPVKSTIKFEFPARGSMPPVTLYWEDGEKNGSPYRPEGIPADEPLGQISDRQIPGPMYAAINGANEARMAAMVAARGGNRGGNRAQGGGRREGQQQQPPRPPSSGSVFIGDKGIMTAGEYGGGPRLVPMSKMEDYRQPPQFLDRTPGTYRDWIRACKGGQEACSNFSIAGPFTEWIALGVVACRMPNTKLLWDAAKMRVTNNAEANKYLVPKVRKGWKMNFKVKTA